jgi:glycolate oxidase iron-sulfur subunit
MPDGYQGLDPCVHCGFCLPACPTYLATGDENESPRGRIVLMRALERGDLLPTDTDLRHHLDNCLGCLGCEPVCPSGVAYGRGLSTARRTLWGSNPSALTQRVMLTIFAAPQLWRPLFTLARWFRATALPRLLAGSGRVGFTWGMLAASSGLPRSRRGHSGPRRVPPSNRDGPTVALFRGCVMDTLFPHVHDAARRVLEVNGFRVVDIPGQQCCGALHEHAGAEEEAQRLAQMNVTAFATGVDYIAVDSAGCGALLKDYGHLLRTAPAVTMAASVRDVSELLADTGPRAGAALPMRVAYDAPCHLHHAQGVVDAPLAVLRAIPELDICLPDGHERCCGSAGLYSLDRPALARQILDDKMASILSHQPDAIVTGNPGCLMQLGAGSFAAGRPIPAVHPVELLDESYRRAGLYRISH